MKEGRRNNKAIDLDSIAINFGSTSLTSIGHLAHWRSLGPYRALLYSTIPLFYLKDHCGAYRIFGIVHMCCAFHLLLFLNNYGMISLMHTSEYLNYFNRTEKSGSSIKIPRGFWKDISNQRKFMDELGKKLSIIYKYNNH